MKTTFLVGKRNYFAKRRRGGWSLLKSPFALCLLLTLLIVLPLLSVFGILSLRWKDNTSKTSKSTHHSHSIQYEQQPQPFQQNSARKETVEVGAKNVLDCSASGRRKTAPSKPCSQKGRRIGNLTTATLWQAADAYLPLSSEAITGFLRNEEKQKSRRSPALIRSWRDEWSGYEEGEGFAGKRSASCGVEVPECDFFLVGKDGKLPDLRKTTNEEKQTNRSSSSDTIHPLLFPTLRLKCCAEHQKMKRALFYVLDIVEGYSRYVNDVFGGRRGAVEVERESAKDVKEGTLVVLGSIELRQRAQAPRPLRAFLDSGTLLAAMRDRPKGQPVGFDERSMKKSIDNSITTPLPPNTLEKSSSSSCSPLLAAASSTLVPWDTDIDLGIIGGAPDDMLRAFGDGLLYLNISQHEQDANLLSEMGEKRVVSESLDLSEKEEQLRYKNKRREEHTSQEAGGGSDQGNGQKDKTAELARRRKRRFILLSKLQSEFQRDLRSSHHLSKHSISAAAGSGGGNQETNEQKANDKGGYMYAPLYPKLSNPRGDWVGLGESSRKQLLATVNPNVFLRAYADWWHWRRDVEGCPVDDAESAFESLFPSYAKYYLRNPDDRHAKKSHNEKAIGSELTPSLHEMSWAPPHYFEPCVTKKKKRRGERKGSEVGGQIPVEGEEVVMCKDAHYIYYAGTKDGIVTDTSRVEVYPFRPYWGKPLKKKNRDKAASKDNAVRINDEDSFFPLASPLSNADDKDTDDVPCDEAHRPVESENNSPIVNRIGNGNDLAYEPGGVVPMLRHPTRPWLDIPMAWAVLSSHSQRCSHLKTTNTTTPSKGREEREKELPQQPCVLWGRPVPCPAEPELYLNHCYGEGDGSWRRPRTIHWGEKNVQPWK